MNKNQLNSLTNVLFRKIHDSVLDAASNWYLGRSASLTNLPCYCYFPRWRDSDDIRRGRHRLAKPVTVLAKTNPGTVRASAWKNLWWHWQLLRRASLRERKKKWPGKIYVNFKLSVCVFLGKKTSFFNLAPHFSSTRRHENSGLVQW